MDWGPLIPGFVCKFLMFDFALRWYRGGDARHAFAAAVGFVLGSLPMDPGVIYLLHPETFGYFAFNGAFLSSARALPPDQVEIREHRDRENEIAFYSVRFVLP